MTTYWNFFYSGIFSILKFFHPGISAIFSTSHENLIRLHFSCPKTSLLGTLFSSLSILIFGCETGYGLHRWKRAFMVSLIASLIQFTTCLIVIGWVWSIMWGIDLVTKSSNYNCDKDNIFEEEELEFQRRMDEKMKNGKDIIAKETQAKEKQAKEIQAKETQAKEIQAKEIQAKETVIEADSKTRRRIQFLDTYLSRNRHMEQMI